MPAHSSAGLGKGLDAQLHSQTPRWAVRHRSQIIPEPSLVKQTTDL
jgi:hypothetical protein